MCLLYCLEKEEGAPIDLIMSHTQCKIAHMLNFHVHHALECVSHLTQRSIHGSNAHKNG